MNVREFLGLVELDPTPAYGIVRPVGSVPVVLQFCGQRVDRQPARRRRESDGFPRWPLSHIDVIVAESYPIVLQRGGGPIFDWQLDRDLAD